MFEVGQEVVCVNAKNANTQEPGKERATHYVKNNEIYTIRNIETFGGSRVWLMFRGMYPTWFEHIDFRPLDYDFVEEVIKQVEPKEELV